MGLVVPPLIDGMLHIVRPDFEAHSAEFEMP